MTLRPKKDLIEIFGYAPDDTTTQCRSLWNLSACPFINKQCTKANHDGSIIYGTCSVSSPYGDCVICPNRLYEDNYAALRTIANEAFDKSLEFLLYEQFIPVRENKKNCVVALGQNSGKEVKIGTSLSMDWVLARIENGKLVEYTGVEVQSIDITGNYRDAWHSYKNIANITLNIPSSEHGMNWANVHKRLIPQIIRKGTIYSRSNFVKSGLYFVVPDIVYQKFEQIIGQDIPLLDKPAKDVLTIHTYELSPFIKHGEQRSLRMKRNIRFSLDEFSQRFVSGSNLPSGEQLDSAVMRVIGLR
ncbi:MAG: NotI family restriction endonuclease [Methyloglobulus sp.]|nr:restriction endonuclease [Methyloglobulus sp.]